MEPPDFEQMAWTLKYSIDDHPRLSEQNHRAITNTLRAVWNARGAADQEKLQPLVEAVKVLDELQAKLENDYQDGVRDDDCDRAASHVINAARALVSAHALRTVDR